MTNLIAKEGPMPAAQIEIKDRTEVIFIIDGGKRIQASIRDGELRIESEGGQLIAKPEARNIIKITTTTGSAL